MNTQEYLDRVKQVLKVDSDYALQKPLNLTRSSISKLRHGGTFSDETAVHIAEVLKMHPGIVMLDMHREREKNPQIQAIWRGMVEKFSMGFESLLSGAGPRRVMFPAC